MEGQSRDGEAIVFLLFSGHFCGAGRGLDGGGQSHDGGYPSPPTKTLWANMFGPRPFIVESLKEA